MTVGDLQQGDIVVVKSFIGGLDTHSRFMEMATIFDYLYECFDLPIIISHLSGWALAIF